MVDERLQLIAALEQQRDQIGCGFEAMTADLIEKVLRGMCDIDGLVTAWRNNGGDKSRAEYQDAISAAK